MSALKYWDKDIQANEEELLEDIINNCYIDIVEACRTGKIHDDNAVIGSILSLMERIIPKILEVYKTDPEEYESMCLGTATALRVTIGSFIPFDKFMEMMNHPQMKDIDNIVNKMVEEGSAEVEEDQLVNIFKSIKNVKSVEPDIYG